MVISVNKQTTNQRKTNTHTIQLGKRLQRRQRLKTNDLQSFVVIFLLRKKDKKYDCWDETPKQTLSWSVPSFVGLSFCWLNPKKIKTSYRLTILFPRPHVFFFGTYIQQQGNKAHPSSSVCVCLCFLLKRGCVVWLLFASFYNEIVIQRCKYLCCITHTHGSFCGWLVAAWNDSLEFALCAERRGRIVAPG